jgi:nucleoside-diphosphate-sugar epimerase
VKRVLVTGATGFAGSHFLEALLQVSGIEVIAACRDRIRLLANFTGQVREGDLRDPDYLDTLLDGVDVVCNAMAWSSLWDHQNESRELFYRPTVRLIEKSIERRVARFVNISTTSAAAPDASRDPLSRGIPKSYWPHLTNVVAIEDLLRRLSRPEFTVVNLRMGIFAGKRYALGVLPILLPRLKTHLVPWVAAGGTSLPIIDGRDVGQAGALAATREGLSGYRSFNIVGPEVPTVRTVIQFLHDEFGYPVPHFSVPFRLAYGFAWLMEKIHPIVPWEPLVTRSIVHLLEEVNASNEQAEQALGYCPRIHWKEAIAAQLSEMAARQTRSMKMARPFV